MNILGDSTAQARQVVKPPKPQPKKSIQPQTGAVAVLPPTHVKPVKPPPSVTTTVGKPHTTVTSNASAPSGGGQGGGNDFGSFLNSLYPAPAPLDVNAIQQPYLDAYNKTLAQLGQAQQTENTFDSKLAGELQTLLSANGIDPGFAKSLQAALQLEALRNSGNTYAFAQGKLTDNYTGPNGLIAQALSSATDEYNKQLPSGSEKLAAWTAYNGQINSQNAAATRAQNTAWDHAYKTAVLAGKTQSAATTIANRTAAQAAKDAKPNVGLSREKGFLVDSNGNMIPGANGRAQVLPGFATNAKGNVVKVSKPGKDLSQPNVTWTNANGYKSDGRGRAIRDANGKLQPIKGWKIVNGVPTKIGTSAGGGKTPSLTSVNSLVTKWHKGTSTTRVPVRDTTTGKILLNPDGTPKYKVTVKGQVPYLKAYRLLISQGLDDKAARQALDSQYKKGELGRAWFTNEQQAVLNRVGARKVYKDPGGHAYLTPTQYAVLNSQNKLPAGKWGKDGGGNQVWYIDPNG